MDIRLDGRSAVVTGASKGLGFAVARAFAEAGADVALVARRPDALAEARRAIAATSKGRILAIPGDVAQASDVAAAYASAMQSFGKIDILVNNAGKSATGAFENLTDADWQADLDLKLFAAVRFCRLVLPQMKERRWGRIINVLNIGAKAPRARSAPTSVSRAAGMALTKVLAAECAPFNVLVNALLVGLIVTDQIVRRHHAEGTNLSLEEYVAKAGAAVPLGRMGKAEEFASLACLLVSDAGGFVTGTAINVDGGMSPVV